MARNARRRADLPIQRAFVVHFASSRGERRRFVGRVEHLVSGQAAELFSLAELLRFLDRSGHRDMNSSGAAVPFQSSPRAPLAETGIDSTRRKR